MPVDDHDDRDDDDCGQTSYGAEFQLPAEILNRKPTFTTAPDANPFHPNHKDRGEKRKNGRDDAKGDHACYIQDAAHHLNNYFALRKIKELCHFSYLLIDLVKT